MQMIEHTIDVRGPKVSDGQRSPDAIGSVLKWVDRLVRDSVSMAFRYTSRAAGRPPAWFVAASTVRFADVSQGRGCTRLHFEAPRLGEAAEEVYHQKELFRTRPPESDTGFDLVGDMIQDVGRRVADSHRFDAGLLGRLKSFRSSRSRWGIESLVLHGHRLPEDEPVAMNDDVVACALELRTVIPEPIRARVAGALDMIRASDGSFELLLPSGDTVQGVLVGNQRDRLHDLWRQRVVIEGQAVFRPSGAPLRVEAEGIAAATDADQFFAKVPKPRASGPGPLAARTAQPQTPKTGAGAIFGQWPGDETDEEILAALKELD